VARKERKIRKRRGSRTCGGGSHKKSRGAGSRGGRSTGGAHKGKWSRIIKYSPDHFGRRGFDVPKGVKHIYRSINVGELDEMIDNLIERGLAKKVKGKVHINLTELDFKKVLGRGRVSRPLVVKAQSFSESATKKIEASGGKAILEG
jgi:large subunit ribosomal protein L15